MTIADWCVLAAALLPLPLAGLAKSAKGFSNRTPREYLEATEGWRRRAHWAQQNSFEAFPPFAAAVIIAQMHAPGRIGTINALALAFIALRVLYGACYIADQATLRSLMWLGSTGCVVALFVTAA